ncbi:MAG: glycosyltransferase [Candidatus Nezhaarchaeota archaeon]|nr:glycosyltransferase [Candidatus Nezhaarchaeota archaeon]
MIVLTTGSDERLKYLDKLLSSLSRQTTKNYELIVASETLSNELQELLGKHFCACESHRIIATGYWNKCRTANKAIRSSKGDIVFLLEDDLSLERNFLEEVLKTLEAYPEIGCVYSRCIWVHSEGLRGRGGVKGLVAKLAGKLSIHEAALPKQSRRINDYLYEAPVFTMSVACRREALYKAGLYDEGVEEPILGEDCDLALRIRRAGYKIFLNTRAVSYHFTKQVAKKVKEVVKKPSYLMGINRSEVYFIAKNRDLLDLGCVVLHVVYRMLESVAWGIRARKILVVVYGICGAVIGFLRGLLRSKS